MSCHIMCILIGLILFIFLHLPAKQLNLKELKEEENSDFLSDELFGGKLI